MKELTKICSCGSRLTEENSKFLGVQEAREEIGCDLELRECRACGSSQAIRINEKDYTDSEIYEIENDLIRKGFFNEATGISDHLKRRKMLFR